jgi:7,8-dihydropterin-6-yl-methyl-4-(beta-D-ribofuranosyl)aminobenzene 5'-phosphate synthase
MVNDLKATVLLNNIAEEPLTPEWGLSVLIEADGRKILLDAGPSDLFARNAELLGIDLSDVGTCVLSHAHDDHSYGIGTFFGINGKAPVLLRKECRGSYYVAYEGVPEYIGMEEGIFEKYPERFSFVEGTCEIFEGAWLVPHRGGDYSDIGLRSSLFIMQDGELVPDGFAHEQSLVFETPRGLVVFNSCSHTGMINILKDIEEALGRTDVCAYFGGLHIFEYTDGELAALCGEIKNASVGRIITGHCTGDHSVEYMQRELGEQVEVISAGRTYTF